MLHLASMAINKFQLCKKTGNALGQKCPSMDISERWPNEEMVLLVVKKNKRTVSLLTFGLSLVIPQTSLYFVHNMDKFQFELDNVRLIKFKTEIMNKVKRESEPESGIVSLLRFRLVNYLALRIYIYPGKRIYLSSKGRFFC